MESLKKQKAKKKHHYIPVFYLKGFIDPTEHPFIWIYEKGNSTIRKDKPENIAFIKNYHTFTTSQRKIDSEYVENAIGKFEREASILFKKIKACEILNNKEKSFFVFFVALMMTRVPTYRKAIQEKASEFLKWKFDSSLSQEKKFVSNIKNDEIEKIRNLNLSGEIVFDVEPIFSLMTFPAAASKITPILFDMTWTFLIATEDFKFATSDNPVVYVDPTQHDFNFNLLNLNTEITFPITQDIVSLGTWGKYKECYVKINNNTIKEINKRTVTAADRYVYYSTKSTSFNKMVQKYKDFYIKIS